MGFAQAIRTCFGKYVTFSGRATRPEYWWFVLFCLLGSLVATAIDAVIFGAPEVTTASAPGSFAMVTRSRGPIGGLFSLVILLPSLAAGWRRMHDTGRSGLHLFLPLLVMVGLALVLGFLGVAISFAMAPLAWLSAIVLALSPLLVLWWLTRPSQPFPNQYGPNPLEVSS